METIIADGLPQGAYEFQATLSNGSRPDCIVRMPNGAPNLVIDAKFPLEAWNAIRESETPDTKKLALAQFRRDIEIHIRDVSEKYLIDQAHENIGSHQHRRAAECTHRKQT